MSQSNSNKKGKSGGQEMVHDVQEVSLMDTDIGKEKEKRNIQNIRITTLVSSFSFYAEYISLHNPMH